MDNDKNLNNHDNPKNTPVGEKPGEGRGEYNPFPPTHGQDSNNTFDQESANSKPANSTQGFSSPGRSPASGSFNARESYGYGGARYGGGLYSTGNSSGRFVKVFVSVFVAVVMFAFGFLAGYFGAPSEEEKLTRWIKNTVEGYFFDGEKTSFDFTSAIGKAMVGAVDEFSNFYTPEEALLLLKEDEGDFVNTGLHLFDTDTLYAYEYRADHPDANMSAVELSPPQPNKVFAFKVYGNSPAYNQGVRAGDVLVSVEQQSIEGQDIYEVNELLSGLFKQKTTVNLTFMRGAQQIDAALKKEEHQPKFSYYYDSQTAGYESLSQNAAVVTFEEFSTGADEDLAQSLKIFKQRNKSVLILDLRNNFGGFLTVLQSVAVHLVADSSGNSLSVPLAVARTKHQSFVAASDAEIISGQYTYADYGFTHIIVLANYYSASATELLISAMKDYNMPMTIVGKRTYGKALMQDRFVYGDYIMTLTVGKLYSAVNENISYNKIGFLPDEGQSVGYTLPGAAMDAQMQRAAELADLY